MWKPSLLTQNLQNGLWIVWQAGPKMQKWIMQRKNVHERQYILYVSCCLVTKSYLFASLSTEAPQAFLSFTVLQSLLKLMSTKSVIPSNHLILCLHLLLLPSVFPSIRSSPISRIFASGGQGIRAPALASFLPMNIQGWFPLGLTGLILQHQFFGAQPFL